MNDNAKRLRNQHMAMWERHKRTELSRGGRTIKLSRDIPHKEPPGEINDHNRLRRLHAENDDRPNRQLKLLLEVSQ